MTRVITYHIVLCSDLLRNVKVLITHSNLDRILPDYDVEGYELNEEEQEINSNWTGLYVLGLKYFDKADQISWAFYIYLFLLKVGLNLCDLC